MADKKRAPLFVLLLALLLPLRAAQESKPRDYTAWLIGHAHIDLSWLWLWEETVHDIAVQTFSGTLTQMNKMPGLTFAQSQAAVYEAIEKSYPELFGQIRQKVREGTWVPVGGMWAEPDLNMPDGEALARQLLYGKNYFRQKFGVDVTVGWNPDSFGHNAQLPQLLRQAGIKYYVFERCAPPNKPFFWWQGLDGSRVLAYVPPGWYLVSLREGVKELLREAGKDTFQKDFLLLYGAGDHGGGPRDSDLEAIARFRNDPEQPRLEFATPESFFHCVEKEGERYPVVSGELNFAFPACYTTQTQTKKNNRQAENLLLTAEKFSALAVFGGWRDYYPERDLDEAWKIVLRNQFHDILDGSSIGPVYGESGSSYREAFNRGERARDFSLAAIANAIDTRGNGLPLVVFNPLAWTRSDTVSAEMALPGEAAAVRVLDQQGRPVPAQVMERQRRQASTLFRFVFLAEDVPACGYSLYRVLPASRPDRAPSDLRVSRDPPGKRVFPHSPRSAHGVVGLTLGQAQPARGVARAGQCAAGDR